MSSVSSRVPALPPVDLFIGGEWREATGSSTEAIVDPATAALLADVTNASVADVDAAVAAARDASDHGAWASATPRQRSEALSRLLAELVAMEDRILDTVVAETGCPVAVSRGQQVGLPLRHLEYWAELARRPELEGRPPVVSTRSDGSTVLGNWAVRREPYGVVAAITPYNFPFLENIMKVGPALAAGNSVVLKASPYTPFSALLLAEAAERAGLAPGALNVVVGGADVGAALTTHPGVDLISFTGSGAVGSAIAAAAAPRCTKVLLELGGKSALIVCRDADLDLAVRVGLQNVVTHAGQGCVLATRQLVDAAVYDDYVAGLAKAASRVTIGDPRQGSTMMGPLIRRTALDRVESMVGGAMASGAEVVTGAERPDLDLGGYYYRPTFLAGLDNTWPIARDEVFGPVGVVIPFADEDQAVAIANDSPLGLAGHIVSRDVGRAFGMATRLRTGSIDINGGPGYTNPGVPFGGIKGSGLGKENGPEGLDEFTSLKVIKYPAG